MNERIDGEGQYERRQRWPKNGTWRLWAGCFVTVLWLAGAGWLVYTRWCDLVALPLNGLGDFFAGVFAPVAFLWLVLGYMQQGQELRLSTEALRLQARELNDSVQQQRHLVELTREQALRIDRAARPRFRVGWSQEGGYFSIANTGAGISDVFAKMIGASGMEIDVAAGSPMLTGETWTIALPVGFDSHESLRLEFKYRDTLGKDLVTTLSGHRTGDSSGVDWLWGEEATKEGGALGV